MTRSVSNPRPRIVKYVPGEGAHFSQAQAATYGPALQEMHDAGVQLNIDSVVATRTDRDSPLHDYFKPQREAAEQFWRVQASRLLRGIDIVVICREDGEDVEHRIRGFHPVEIPLVGEEHLVSADDVAGELDSDDDELPTTQTVYLPIHAAAAEETYRIQIIEQARQEAKQFRNKWKRYVALLPELGQHYRGLDNDLARLHDALEALV
jgi:hypothetical protein